MHEVLEAIGVLARDTGQAAFLVGGMVRDLAIGHRNIDLDIAIEGDALGLGTAFAKKTGSSIRGRTRFGTCKIESKAFGTIDMATARSESYPYPGALPEVKASNLEADLARRDFGLNAMAIALAPECYGRLIDPFGGLDDLARGKLRVLHNASFRDDPTRIFRGVRFAGRFDFTFEHETLNLLKECLREGFMDAVSGKRIFAELKLTGGEQEPLKSFGLLRKYRILESVDPAIGRNSDRWKHLRRLVLAIDRVASPDGRAFAEDWLCWLSGIFVGLKRREAQRLAARLNLPGRVNGTCLWVSTSLQSTLAGLLRLDRSRPYRVVKLLRQVPPEGAVHLFAASGRKQRNLIIAYLKTWRYVKPSLNGRQVRDLGFEEGPRVGRMLERLLELKLQGKVVSPEDEIAYVRKMARSGR